MEDFPKGDGNIQQADSRYCSANPSGSNHCLETIETGFARGVQKKIIAAPFAKTERALGNPWQQRKHDANLKAKHDIENDTELG